jgi:hypothetical protein
MSFILKKNTSDGSQGRGVNRMQPARQGCELFYHTVIGKVKAVVVHWAKPSNQDGAAHKSHGQIW